MESITIIGSGGHTKVVIDVIEAEGKYKIEAIVCDFAKPGTEILGYKVIGGLDMLKDLPQFGIIAIGDNFFREQHEAKIKELCPDFEFVSAVHPSAIVSKHATIGAGMLIQAGAAIKADTQIGNHCIVNSNVSIGHDIVIDDYVTIGPGAMVGGFTRIGKGSAVNVGSVVRDRITIGEYSIVGMGAVVTRDIPAYVVAYGNPAKIIRSREKSDRFYR